MNPEKSCKEGIYELLNPENCALALIDFEPQMVFGVNSMDRQLLIDNVAALSKAAKIFNIPTILTTVAAKTFSGEMLSQIKEVFPDIKPIDRTNMNSWEDVNFRNAIKNTKRKKLIMAALWTEVCLAFPVLSALEEGYEVYIVTDTCGGISKKIHKTAIKRLIQAGARPVTWMQVLLEFQRDWAKTETYEQVTELLKEYGGAYGAGIYYAQTFFKHK